MSEAGGVEAGAAAAVGEAALVGGGCLLGEVDRRRGVVAISSTGGGRGCDAPPGPRGPGRRLGSEAVGAVAGAAAAVGEAALVGGGCLLRGLAQRIERETHVPVRMSPMPLEAVVLGAGHCIEHYEALKGMFMGARR